MFVALNSFLYINFFSLLSCLLHVYFKHYWFWAFQSLFIWACLLRSFVLISSFRSFVLMLLMLSLTCFLLSFFLVFSLRSFVLMLLMLSLNLSFVLCINQSTIRTLILCISQFASRLLFCSLSFRRFFRFFRHANSSLTHSLLRKLSKHSRRSWMTSSALILFDINDTKTWNASIVSFWISRAKKLLLLSIRTKCSNYLSFFFSIWCKSSFKISIEIFIDAFDSNHHWERIRKSWFDQCRLTFENDANQISFWSFFVWKQACMIDDIISLFIIFAHIV